MLMLNQEIPCASLTHPVAQCGIALEIRHRCTDFPGLGVDPATEINCWQRCSKTRYFVEVALGIMHAMISIQ